jgi:hypothetical protein
LSRRVFYGLAGMAVVGLAFAQGLYAGSNKTPVYRAVMAAKAQVAESLHAVVGEASTLTHTHPSHFLQPSRRPGSGVTVNSPKVGQRDLILMTGFFDETNELRLIRRNGDVVARWPVKFTSLFPKPTHIPKDSVPETDWNVDTHGGRALPDGSVVFNFEWDGLVKLDRCGAVQWTVAKQTHHSVIQSEDGGFVVPGRRLLEQSPFPPFEAPIREDTILRISPDGKVLSEISVPRLLYQNGMMPVLTATGTWFWKGMPWDHEITHLNKVDELSTALAPDFPMFEAGDLLLSLRDHNLLVVADKTGTKIKWWQIGPWIRQHAPSFQPGGRIVMFNNNIFETAFGTDPEKTIAEPGTPRISDILEFRPATGETRVLYGGTSKEDLLSVIRGKVDVTPTNGLLITEFEGGRVFETDTDGQVLWEFINRYSPTEVAEVSTAHLYPQGYFTVKDWSCPAKGGEQQ